MLLPEEHAQEPVASVALDVHRLLLEVYGSFEQVESIDEKVLASVLVPSITYSLGEGRSGFVGVKTAYRQVRGYLRARIKAPTGFPHLIHPNLYKGVEEAVEGFSVGLKKHTELEDSSSFVDWLKGFANKVKALDERVSVQAFFHDSTYRDENGRKCTTELVELFVSDIEADKEPLMGIIITLVFEY